MSPASSGSSHEGLRLKVFAWTACRTGPKVSNEHGETTTTSSGLSVLRELSRAKPELPVVIVSARSDLPTKLRGFGFGATDYLSKPFSFDELVARIRVQLRKAANGDNGHIVRAGELALDVARREARFGTVTTQLSDREFRVLHHLVEHQGEVISRERLLSEVWGYHFDPGSNVVDVCIRRLRKKLGADAPIETVRHAGYRVTAA